MRALLRRLFSCRHRHTYRERRPLGEVFVMHLVCDACGAAVPAVRRTTAEYRDIAEDEASLARGRRIVRREHRSAVVPFADARAKSKF